MPEKLKPLDPRDFIQPTCIIARRNGGNRPKLTTGDKIAIVHKILCQHVPEKNVAKEFRISRGYVSTLSNKARRNPGVLREIVSE